MSGRVRPVGTVATCPECGGEFTIKRSNTGQVYCSAACKRERDLRKKREAQRDRDRSQAFDVAAVNRRIFAAAKAVQHETGLTDAEIWERIRANDVLGGNAW